jgi:predicted Zn-ribbon and HTH transcriptional regulator
MKPSEKPPCTCLRCGYEWEPRVDNPKCCPTCLSRKWNIKRK